MYFPILLKGLFVLGVVAAVGHHDVQAQQNLLRNGGMEGPYADGIADGWVKNCYGIHEVVFAEEKTDIHGGKSAQRVTCTKFRSGGVQFYSARLTVEKGKPYTVRLWMKGDLSSPVDDRTIGGRGRPTSQTIDAVPPTTRKGHPPR